MGAIWLHDLPQILTAAGLEWVAYPGWETRSRSTGGYERVLAVQCHHDASSTSWTLKQAMDRAYSPSNPDRPVGALWLDRNGIVGLGAAGATNTSGKGGPLVTSKGVIPKDQANLYVISIEAMNNGVGEIWSDRQLAAYRRLCAALCRAYDLDPLHRGDLHGHYEWTTRKIDPAGGKRQHPYARVGDSALRWDMDRFRRDVKNLEVPMADKWQPRQQRLVDTRSSPGFGSPMVHGQKITVQVPDHGGAMAATVNLTLAGASQQCWAVAYPTGAKRPNTSSLNSDPNTPAVANEVQVGLDSKGRFDIYVSGDGRPGGVTHVIADLVGLWYA